MLIQLKSVCVIDWPSGCPKKVIIVKTNATTTEPVPTKAAMVFGNFLKPKPLIKKPIRGNNGIRYM